MLQLSVKMSPAKPLNYRQALLSSIHQPPQPKTTASSPKQSKLLLLPTELQNNIISHLDIPSTLILRLTNRHFYTLNSCPTHTTLLLAERTPWAVTLNLYSCMDCLRLKPQAKFATAMLNGPKGRNGKDPQKRFCVECGLKGPRSRYSPGAEIVVEGKRHVLCKECKVYSGEVGCVGSGMCASCHGKKGCGEMCRNKKGRARQQRRERERDRESHIRGSLGDAMIDLAENPEDWMYNEYWWETHD
jgi:hypothetical protein